MSCALAIIYIDNTRDILYTINMTAKQVMDKLLANGWTLARINSSHHIFTKPGYRNVAVPLHGNRDIGHFAKRILKEAGIEL
ncbi:hypothetical protein FACS1894151_07770 [Spirochaetia bacterium]|nr:hypothetical protein FACS1894151_07770 [Spirochaetia bacterium]